MVKGLAGFGASGAGCPSEGGRPQDIAPSSARTSPADDHEEVESKVTIRSGCKVPEDPGTSIERYPGDCAIGVVKAPVMS